MLFRSLGAGSEDKSREKPAYRRKKKPPKKIDAYHAEDPEKGGWEPRGELAYTEDPVAEHDQPVIKHGFLKLRLAEYPGRYPFSGVQHLFRDRKSTRLNSSHIPLSRMPSSA